MAREGSGGRHPLDSDRGTTIVEEPVIASIVSAAVYEAEGARPTTGGTRVPGDTSPTVGEFLSNLTAGGGRARGVSVESGEREAAVDLTLTVPYGESIPRVTQTLRDTVVERVQKIAGIEVTEVNITVADVNSQQQ